MNQTLFAWANPLKPKSMIGFLDHTWVTSYPFKNNQYPDFEDIPKDGNYWYCWGAYHPAGNGGIYYNPNGAIGKKQGDLDISSKLVNPNLAPPQYPGTDHDPQGGSIFYYAIDGVCHMVANQALYSTGIDGQEPMRVLEANGYHVSSFFYTDYGLNTKAWEDLVQKHAPNIIAPPDNFATRLETLGFTETEVSEVKAIRRTAQNAFVELHPDVPLLNVLQVYYRVANIIYDAYKELKTALGEDDFSKLFPSFKKFPQTLDEAAYWIDQQQLTFSIEAIQRVEQMRQD